MAIDLIDQVRVLHGRKGSYLFPKYGDPDKPGPMSRHVLSRNVLKLCADTGVTKFVPRDLRRTVKTRMGELGIAKDIRDRLQNDGVISWKLRFQLGTWYQCENPAYLNTVNDRKWETQ